VWGGGGRTPRDTFGGLKGKWGRENEGGGDGLYKTDYLNQQLFPASSV
jgi:hypothetical protein